MSERRIALCLSGGGFRASLFHLGVLRRLFETGVLHRIDTISSVSGGAIIAAFLADRMIDSGGLDAIDDWTEWMSQPFHRFAARDLRSAPVLRNIAWSWLAPGTLARAMVRAYRKHLTTRSLGELPRRPRFIFCATDVCFGVNWVFSRDRIGDYQAGYSPPLQALDLAFAVAASSCFPPLFGPLKVPIDPGQLKGGAYRGADRDRIVARLALTDGGVYDNLGLEPALRRHNAVIVSDAGGPFPFTVSRTPLLRYFRYPSLVMKQVSALRKRQLMSQIDDARWHCEAEDTAKACRVRLERDGCLHRNDPQCKDFRRGRVLRRGLYLGIHSDVDGYRPQSGERSDWVGYDRDLVKSRIAAIRTDLDRFTRAERCILENHGYSLAEAGLRRHLADLAGDHETPAQIPHPDMIDPELVRQSLKHSHRRISLRRLLKK